MPRASFAAELYLPSAGPERFPTIADRARAAADEMASEGHDIRYRGAVLLTDDETCFCFFEAQSEDEVREASRRAEVTFDRIVPAAADVAAVAERAELAVVSIGVQQGLDKEEE